MAFTSLGVVLISTMTFVLGTFPEFQTKEETGLEPEYPWMVMIMSVIDNIAVGFFLIEYVVSRRRQPLVTWSSTFTFRSGLLVPQGSFSFSSDP